jgi:hypothetical protein
VEVSFVFLKKGIIYQNIRRSKCWISDVKDALTKLLTSIALFLAIFLFFEKESHYIA